VKIPEAHIMSPLFSLGLVLPLWASSSCTPTVLKIPKLALTFYLEKGTVVECATDSSIQK